MPRAALKTFSANAAVFMAAGGAVLNCSLFNCSLRSLRIALGTRLLRRRSPTKSVSAHSSAARRRAIRCSIAPLAALAPRGSRPEAASFVVARRRKAYPLTPPQHGGARSGLQRHLRLLLW